MNKYDHKIIEEKWYKHWEEKEIFKPDNKNDNSYCIMLPPPNVTGSLHMGHGFQSTLMDILIRYNKMKGKNVLWQAGTDHAGIATQMVVERNLQQQGIKKTDLSREEFIEKIWDWKEQSGGRITQQLRKMGASIDWSRERFTLDENFSFTVTDVFISLYKEGLIYRGKRLINWDPMLLTALSDLEVITEEEKGKIWTIKYYLTDKSDFVEVATTRPETLFGDVAVAVNPNDERYYDFHHKKLLVPICNREIPIILDESIDIGFGTGAVKITPAHDFNDYVIGEKNNLNTINIFNSDASLNDNANPEYIGLDRVVARDEIIKHLKTLNLLSKEEDHLMKVPRGDRSGVIIEPRLTEQWFMNMKPLAVDAIKVVKSQDIKFIPKNWDKTYFQWLENIEDWCISRQLSWGHRIPAWYDADGNIYVGKDKQNIIEENNLDNNIELIQDEDVLDTWFSSSLWPFVTLGWPNQTTDLQNFYPTQVLITGFDIIFFWVSRMIMMGLKLTGEIPFKEVYITGLIRDFHGKKMSKSKGNIIDPLDIINGISLEDMIVKRTKGLMQPKIKEAIKSQTISDFPDGIQAYGCDALRYTFCALANTGTNINFDMKRLNGYKNFCNKLWNATKYVLIQTEGYQLKYPEEFNKVDLWILSKFQDLISKTEKHITSYRFDLYAKEMHEFVWHEYCDWYLELTKPILYGENIAHKDSTKYTLIYILENILYLLHPVIPYITEEIWQVIDNKFELSKESSICLQPFPQIQQEFICNDILIDIEILKSIILSVRNIRGEMNIPNSKKISLRFFTKDTNLITLLNDVEIFIINLARADEIKLLEAKDTEDNIISEQIGDLTISIPFSGLINKDAELSRIMKQLKKLIIEKEKLIFKLEKTTFCQQAPKKVVAKEHQKLTDINKKEDELLIQKKKFENMD